LTARPAHRKAAFDAFAAVYRAELKPFGIDFVVAGAGNMRTGGPAKTAAALTSVGEGMTSEQRELYGKGFETFATTLNKMQSSGLDSSRPRGGSSNSPSKHPRRAGEQWAQTRKRFFGSSMRNPIRNRMRFASGWSDWKGDGRAP